jgi:hypothetical protein
MRKNVVESVVELSLEIPERRSGGTRLQAPAA